jgi:hypothetical protein
MEGFTLLYRRQITNRLLLETRKNLISTCLNMMFGAPGYGAICRG